MNILIRTIFAVLVLSLGIAALLKSSPQTAAPAETERGPVIVELFTSEGCSSCPPADALLAKLEQAQPIPGAQVIALEEHVDYWDGLGWSDPYSSAKFTARQREYAFRFGRGSSYTPQMIVDGQVEFVGSRSNQARSEIERAAAMPKAKLLLTVSSPEASEINVAISGSIPPTQLPNHTGELWVAVTERGLHSNVTGGENSGEDLHHSSVVRSLQRAGKVSWDKDPAFSSDLRLKLDPTWSRPNLQIVAFLEDSKSHKIVGAGAAALGQ